MAEYNSFDDVVTPLDQHKWPVQDGAMSRPPGELLSLAQVLTHVLTSPVEITASAPLIELINTGAGGGSWILFVNAATARLNFSPDGGTSLPLQIDDNADDGLLQIGLVATDQVTIDGDLVVTGSISDRAFKEGFDVGTIEDYMERARLQKHLPDVPKERNEVIQEGGEEKEVIDVGTHIGGQLMALERLFFYVENLGEENKTLRARLDALEAP